MWAVVCQPDICKMSTYAFLYLCMNVCMHMVHLVSAHFSWLAEQLLPLKDRMNTISYVIQERNQCTQRHEAGKIILVVGAAYLFSMKHQITVVWVRLKQYHEEQ